MKLPPDIERSISKSVLQLRKESPFFATLALFTNFHCSEILTTAGTDGKDIFFNPDFVRNLPEKQLTGLLLHEVLHAALLHPTRRGQREPLLWNVAADIVVNGAIASFGAFELPPGGVRDPKLEHLSAEEIYEILLPNATYYSISLLDLLDGPPADAGGGSLSRSEKAAIEAHWRAAMQQAIVIARSSKSQGSIPAGMDRELGALTEAQLDWRSYLWRYLVKTPTDFMGFDRRFIGRGLYLESLEGESVQVFVAIDTSGSIGDEQMRLFLGEVAGILNSYPHLQCQLYYADAQAYGPYSLSAKAEIPPPVGGGGTSFVPFFEKVSENWDSQSTGVCVYLTDGYGNFPDEPPPLPVLWVVTPGGLGLEHFPFGETVRLISNN
ncbi:MAG: VWA-like domain-containing protein [Cyanobacteriota bacterium]|nr:VWA-like domain-containing protein [Cyanobacteriota bacterium]